MESKYLFNDVDDDDDDDSDDIGFLRPDEPRW